MSVIYKYPLKVTDIQTVTLPQGAVPLSVGVQWVRDVDGNAHNVVLWAQHDPTKLTEQREVRFVGTGQQFSFEGAHTFLGTVQESGFVWHIFIKDLVSG